MTKQETTINELLKIGKTYKEITKSLGINPQSLYNAIWRMRRKGVELKKDYKPLPLSPTQSVVLWHYYQKISIPEIAKKLGIGCQTVMNHATQGFARLGLTTTGQDRIAALKTIFGDPKQQEPITLDDPFFN